MRMRWHTYSVLLRLLAGLFTFSREIIEKKYCPVGAGDEERSQMQQLKDWFSNKEWRRTCLVRALCLALFLAGGILIYRCLDLVVTDDTKSWTRVTFHDFYEADRELDYCFVGSSHVMRAVNTEKLAEDLGKETFNLGSSHQDFAGSYYTLREAVSSKKVDHVILGVSISVLFTEKTNETAAYIISDYMKSPLNRIQYLTDLFESDRYINSFLRLRRNFDPQKVPSLAELGKVYEAKQTADYKNFEGTAAYQGRGQWNTEEKVGDDTVAIYLGAVSLDDYKIEDVQERQLAYLQKCIDFCRDKGIKLTLLIDPYFEYYFIHFTEYEEINDLVHSMARENGIDVIDLNTVKEQYLDLELSDFVNMDHVNLRGSEKIADFLAEYLTDPSGDYFHDSLSERYPEREGILWAGYERYYLTKEGEYEARKDAKGSLEGIKFEVFGLSYEDVPIKARLFKVERVSDKDPWENVEEYTGVQAGDTRVQFTVPAVDLKPVYRLQLLDPRTEEILYETITSFDMV